MCGRKALPGPGRSGGSSGSRDHTSKRRRVSLSAASCHLLPSVSVASGLQRACRGGRNPAWPAGVRAPAGGQAAISDTSPRPRKVSPSRCEIGGATSGRRERENKTESHGVYAADHGSPHSSVQANQEARSHSRYSWEKAAAGGLDQGGSTCRVDAFCPLESQLRPCWLSLPAAQPRTPPQCHRLLWGRASRG